MAALPGLAHGAESRMPIQPPPGGIPTLATRPGIAPDALRLRETTRILGCRQGGHRSAHGRLAKVGCTNLGNAAPELGVAPKFTCLVLHRGIYDRCTMDFAQATCGRVLTVRASTGDLAPGGGGSHETAAVGLGCAAGPQVTVMRSSIRAAVV